MNIIRLLSLVCTAVLTACAAPQLRGGVFEPPQVAPEIVLTTQNGTAYALSQQRGRVVLLFFGYTNCPDVCPRLWPTPQPRCASWARVAGKCRWSLSP